MQPWFLNWMIGRQRYLVADYERSNFSISQCKWEGSLVQNIVAIPPPASRLLPLLVLLVAIVCLGFLLIILFVSIRKFPSLKIFSDRSSQEVTKLGTSNQTLAELSSPSVMQELDGREYSRPELYGVEHIGSETDGLHDLIPELPALEEVASETPA